MPNYEITQAEDREFDSFQFFDGKAMVPVEGRFWRRTYVLKEGAVKASSLQIIRNYANAIRKAGGMVFTEGRCEGKQYGEWEGWLAINAHGYGEWYEMFVVERQAMRQDVTANAMLEALNRDGFVALYINFDVNKADIKPESKHIVDEIAVLLKNNPSLKVRTEGHTDNTGDAQKNKILSEQRAQSVKNALVKLGIDAGRMKAVGWGQERPIADNRSEEGRAKNRRVEIVKE